MPWTFRPPQIFPAIFPQILRESAASPETEVFFGSHSSHGAALDQASRLSRFRWCIRQSPGSYLAMTELEESYQFRAKIIREGNRYHVYVIAKPARVVEIIALNPHLGPLMALIAP